MGAGCLTEGVFTSVSDVQEAVFVLVLSIDLSHGWTTMRRGCECGSTNKSVRANLDWGIVLLTKRKMAFSGASWIRLRMIHMNCAIVMSLGTRNLRLSISGICDFGTRSTTTWIDAEGPAMSDGKCTFENVPEFVRDIWPESFQLPACVALRIEEMNEGPRGTRRTAYRLESLPWIEISS